MRASTPTIVLAFAASVFFSGGTAAAEEARANVRTLRYDTRIDLSVTGMAALWLAASEVLKEQLVPEKCRWCYRGEDGTSALNTYDRWCRQRLLWKDTRSADTASSVLGFALLPLGALGTTALAAQHDGNLHGYPLDALVIVEATLLAGDVNQFVKFAFARERPFVHFLPRAPEGVRKLTDSPSDDNLSFFSGHTNLAFAIATSSGTTASMRGYRIAPVVWAVGLTAATVVGYLRIAADKHYLSDVLTAVVVGSAVGIGVPLLFHSQRSSSDTAAPASAGQPLVAPAHAPFGFGGAF